MPVRIAPPERQRQQSESHASDEDEGESVESSADPAGPGLRPAPGANPFRGGMVPRAAAAPRQLSEEEEGNSGVGAYPAGGPAEEEEEVQSRSVFSDASTDVEERAARRAAYEADMERR